MEVRLSEEATETIVTLSLNVYPLEVIYRVCYEFTDQYYLWLEPHGYGDICVRMSPKIGLMSHAQIRGEFGNALIDYAVRWSVTRETKNVREVIISAALAEIHSSPKRDL